MANITSRVQPPRTCKQKGVIRCNQQLEAADSIEDDNPEQEIGGTSEPEIKVGVKTNEFKGNTTQNPLEGNDKHVQYIDKPNLLTKSPYVLSEKAKFLQSASSSFTYLRIFGPQIHDLNTGHNNFRTHGNGKNGRNGIDQI